MQVDALLNGVEGEPPPVAWIVDQLEALGYGSWAHRIVNTAGTDLAAGHLGCISVLQGHDKAFRVDWADAMMKGSSHQRHRARRVSCIVDSAVLTWETCCHGQRLSAVGVCRFRAAKQAQARLPGGFHAW